jgi:hypothetical protein
MSASVSTANTFVLRFWLERSISGVRWRGSIEHIPSGARSEFLCVDEMLKFFQSFQILLEDNRGDGFKSEGQEGKETE